MGRNLIRTLLANGFRARALTRSVHSAQTIKELGAEPWPGELDDEANMRHGMEGCELVFHAAACVDEWGPEEHFFEVNVQGTESVLRAARAAGVPTLVHIGTEAVLWGGRPLHGADESWAIPARPTGPYARTKAKAERLVRSANGPGLRTVVIRPRFIWGRDDTSLLPKLAESVEQNRFVWIAGGRYRTSTCHVANACHGALLAAERGRGGSVYFITDGAPVEFRGFLTDLLATRGLDPGRRSIPRPIARAVAAGSEALWKALRLSGLPPLTRTALRVVGDELTVSDALARRELGYSPLLNVEQGLRELRHDAW